ncbi:MAG: transglycosylase SLT domain-containing protein [Rhodospirillales bacterium]|nr:transglycosylase SLT domain-containing protein [Rhodospirillales bacterium]
MDAKPASQPRISPQIRAAFAEPSRRGQAAFAELLATAKRESGLDPAAQNPRSSAAGLFQFTEQTWLDLVRRTGARHGLGAAAAKIVRDPATGRYEVPGGEDRQAILALRKAPKAAAAMAGELTAQNRKSLTAALGREPTYQEVYTAHFLGARGAVRLIQAAERSPETPSNRLLPVAAKANREVFRDSETRRYRTAGELAEHLTAAPAAKSGAEYLDGIVEARKAAPLYLAQLQG